MLNYLLKFALAVCIGLSSPAGGISDSTETAATLQDMYLDGGSTIILTAQHDFPSTDDMQTAVNMVRARLNFLGYNSAEAVIQDGNKIRVEIPDVSVSEEFANNLCVTAQLKFVDYQGNTIMTGDQIEKATCDYGLIYNDIRQYYINLKFTDEGRRMFAAATETAASAGSGQNYIGVMLDDDMLMMPKVYEKIDTDGCIITGGANGYTKAEAEYYAAVISAGQLPFSLAVLELKTADGLK